MSDTQITSIRARRESDTHLFQDETATPTTDRDKSTKPLNLTNLVQTRGATALVVPIDTARLYDAPVGESSAIVRALELLRQVSGYFSEARKAANLIDADRVLQRAQTALPKLFALRSIGDGFAVVVNSLYMAFINLHGKPMNQAQIEVGWRLVRELQDSSRSFARTRRATSRRTRRAWFGG